MYAGDMKQMTVLQKTRRIEENNKNILECEGRGEGRTVIFRLLTVTGLFEKRLLLKRKIR